MAENKEKPKYEPQMDNLKTNELAFYALSQAKENPQYALAGLHEFYSKRVKGFDKDPLFAEMFGEASAGLANGSISHSGLIRGMNFWAGEYEKSMQKTNLKEYLAYAEERGLKDLPKEFKALAEKYSDKTIEEIKKLAKDEEDAKKLYHAVETIRQYIISAKLHEGIVKRQTVKTLESLVEEKD